MKYLDFTKGYVNMRNWQPKITQKDIDKDKTHKLMPFFYDNDIGQL